MPNSKWEIHANLQSMYMHMYMIWHVCKTSWLKKQTQTDFKDKMVYKTQQNNFASQWSCPVLSYTLQSPLLWAWWMDISTLFCTLVAKISAVQKAWNWQTFTTVLNHHCDLDLEHSNQVFSQNTLTYDEYHCTKSGCKRISSSEYIIQIIIFWLYQS